MWLTNRLLRCHLGCCTRNRERIVGRRASSESNVRWHGEACLLSGHADTTVEKGVSVLERIRNVYVLLDVALLS